MSNAAVTLPYIESEAGAALRPSSRTNGAGTAVVAQLSFAATLGDVVCSWCPHALFELRGG